MQLFLQKATLADYPTLQNMARFYVYDLSRTCGNSPGWECPDDGLFESFDFKKYFEEEGRHAFMVRFNNELAGFVLINKVGTSPDTDWNVGEFFILAKFQGKSLGSQVAIQIWDLFPGVWEVSVIPQNRALSFWRQTVANYSKGNYSEDIREVDYDPHQPRVIFTFVSPVQNSQAQKKLTVRWASKNDLKDMVALSRQKRLAYEQVQPKFWRSYPKADGIQEIWFEDLLDRPDFFILVCEGESLTLEGFIVGQIIKAPEVYNPGGLTMLVDDFCVIKPDLWRNVGFELLKAAEQVTKEKGSTQNLVVCGHHDQEKRQFLRSYGLTIASEWYVS